VEENLFTTIRGGLFALFMIALMFFCSACSRQERIPTTIDMQQLKSYTAQRMAEHTAVINHRMEQQAKHGTP
jgi:hypothetical protein